MSTIEHVFLCFCGENSAITEKIIPFYCPKCNRLAHYYGTQEVDEKTDKVIKSWEDPDYVRSNRQPKQSYSVPSKPTVTCPYCQSTDCKKISGMSRWASTGLFGLASGKLGKQWHCNNCKSDF